VKLPGSSFIQTGRLLYPTGQGPRSTARKGARMKRAILLPTSSRPRHLVCPACESGELQAHANGLAEVVRPLQVVREIER
jgi:hypothetical protein